MVQINTSAGATTSGTVVLHPNEMIRLARWALDVLGLSDLTPSKEEPPAPAPGFSGFSFSGYPILRSQGERSSGDPVRLRP